MKFSKRSLGSLLALGLGVPFFCHAQESPRLEPPTGPLLASAANPSQWVITFTYPQDRAKSGSPAGFVETRTRTITTIKSGKIMDIETVDALGHKRSDWRVGRDLYAKWTGAPGWSQVPDKQVGPVIDFRGLEWIAKESYVGKLPFQGQTCFVFVKNPPPGFSVTDSGDSMDALNHFQQVAFVSAQTRLPIEVRSFGDYEAFRFSDPAPEHLALPPDLVQQLKHDQAILDRLSGQSAPTDNQ